MLICVFVSWCSWNTKKAVRRTRPRRSTTSCPRQQRCISPSRCQRSRARCSEALFVSSLFQRRHFSVYIAAFLFLKTKYKKDKEDLPNTLFSLLPETLETQFVKEMAEMHSEVRVWNHLSSFTASCSLHVKHLPNEQVAPDSYQCVVDSISQRFYSFSQSDKFKKWAFFNGVWQLKK